MEILQPKLRFPEFEGDWGKDKLSDINIFVIDGDRGVNYPNGDDFSNDGFCVFLNAKNVTKNGFSFADKMFISAEKDEKLRKGKLVRNDIVLTTRGSVGHISYFDYSVLYENIRINSGMVIIRTDQSKINSDYLYKYFNSNQIQNEIDKISFGSAQPQLTVKEILKFRISYPSLEEQTKIANFLSSIDEKINLLKEKKALLEEYKKGMMQKIFNQEIRFAADNGNDFEDWEEKTLGEVSSKESSNISANKIEDNFGEFIIYGASGVLKKVNFYLQENDYISIVKDGAGVGRIFYCEGKSSVLGTMEMIKPIKGINTYFLYCLLNNIDFTKFITGSTIPHIYFKDYSKVICGIPSLKEQTKIANFLSTIDEKISLVATQIEDTQEYKKGLLQQMFV
jgi:type I restriction enzyme S subunit